ncbi:glycosyltransferase family 2 protein [bacterium]|nr:glycosyltransferase family 2 protein [bacterium]
MDELISIIIPVYNEEKAIGQVIDEVKEVMNNNQYKYEFIIVDDASTDKTVEIALSKKVKPIKHFMHKGSGAARKTGIKIAKGSIIVMLDGDGTYSPEDIPRMLELFPQCDQVIGKRTSEKGSFVLFRKPVKWLIKKLASYLTGVKIPDLNSGLRAFKKDLMVKYLWAFPDGFSCVSTMTVAFLCNGYMVKWIPTEYRSRIGRSKFHPIKDTYNYILTVIKIVMYFNPLKIFLPLSFLLMTLGIVKTLYDFFFVVGKMQMSDIVIILSSLLIAVFGFLADLIVVQGKAKDYNSSGENK